MNYEEKPIILSFCCGTFSCWSSFQDPAVDTDHDFYNGYPKNRSCQRLHK